MNERESALKVLVKLDRDGAYANKAIADEFRNKNCSAREKGLVTELVMGCIKRRELLDFYIMQFSKIKIRKMSYWVRNILELGAYQIMFLSKIPNSAACSESVALTKRYAARSGGFVNAVLRSLVRAKDGGSLKQLDRMGGDAEYFAVMYSYPLWMVNILIDEYGAQECEKILAESDKPHSPMIRVNPLKYECMTDGKVDDLKCIELLKRDGIMAVPDNEIDGCFYVNGGLDISASKLYREGYYSLQNRSSQAAVLALDPKPGDNVIDVCAAPGGKTTAIAERMRNKGRIKAFDIHEHKVELIKCAAKRLQIDIIEAECHDAAVCDENCIGIFDRVLVDAPCSGLGVMHTKPDIRRTRKQEDIEELAQIQSKILEASYKYLKRGGILVYSTCTILRRENENQVRTFLKRHQDFELIGENKLMTHKTGGSGFYIAKMKYSK